MKERALTNDLKWAVRPMLGGWTSPAPLRTSTCRQQYTTQAHKRMDLSEYLLMVLYLHDIAPLVEGSGVPLGERRADGYCGTTRVEWESWQSTNNKRACVPVWFSSFEIIPNVVLNGNIHQQSVCDAKNLVTVFRPHDKVQRRAWPFHGLLKGQACPQSFIS